MKRFCHGRSLNSDPASGPAVTGKVSMNAITLAAGESPGLSQGCGPDDGGSRPIEVRLIVFRCGPASPIWLPSYQFFGWPMIQLFFLLPRRSAKFYIRNLQMPPGPVSFLRGLTTTQCPLFSGKAD